MALGKALEQHRFSRRALAMSLDGSDGQAVPVTVCDSLSWPENADGGDRRWVGYPVTVSDWVDMGAAPVPGNADPPPLNITSVTVYVPGLL